MVIKVKPPLKIEEVDIEMAYECMMLLKRIAINMSRIEAIRTLRYIYPQLGLIEAKNFIEKVMKDA